MTVYFDCNATTPLDPAVRDVVLHYLLVDFGNAGSRTHEYGVRAKRAVERAREQVADLLGASADEVLFTSGATESNNIALLGLAAEGRRTGKLHVISSEIEHKAVLEPLKYLEEQGFEVTLLRPAPGGYVEAQELRQVLRPDTLLVSLMHVNNETGVIQPLDEYARILEKSDAYFHVDAAQGFGKAGGLEHTRIDLISISGHKIYAPKGIGALVARKRGWSRPPLQPLMFGGGQERGIRPGTLPVHLIAGLGEAAHQAQAQRETRRAACKRIKEILSEALAPLQPIIHGAQNRVLDTTLNVAFPGLDAEAALVALRGVAAVSNGAACTSHSYEPSRVLRAMGLGEESVSGALRFSWCHLTPVAEWASLVPALARLAATQ